MPKINPDDHARVWTSEDGRFTLTLDYDHYSTESGFGRDYLAYTFYDGDELIFEGDDYSPSPLWKDYTSDDSVYGVLGFLAVIPGDLEPEYFEKYTPRQMEWAASGAAEELSYIISDYEEEESSNER